MRLCRLSGAVLIGSFLGLALSGFTSSPKLLTFEDRVKAQEAIERVYYNHRIWPKKNPQPKPPFEQMVPRSVIEAKVTDYLKKCNALDKYWQRPIRPEQVQVEVADSLAFLEAGVCLGLMEIVKLECDCNLAR